jgi:hypothetical protein
LVRFGILLWTSLVDIDCPVARILDPKMSELKSSGKESVDAGTFGFTSSVFDTASYVFTRTTHAIGSAGQSVVNHSADAILLGVLRMAVGGTVLIDADDIKCDLANGNVAITDLDLQPEVIFKQQQNRP